MHRRAFLKSAAGAGAFAVSAGLAGPAISQRLDARTLRFVPQADLANFDPIWNTQYVVRNGAALVWDMLYGVNANLQPQRQMVESEEVSADRLTWTFRLRSNLKFHDGEPVLAKDVVASLARWQARDNMGLMVKAIENELVAVDDRTFRWRLKRPYSKLLVALGKVGTPSCFMMPARIAATDPFKPIADYVGSGPMKLVRSESGREGGIREVRRLRAPRGAELLAVRRQADPGGPHRVGRDGRSGNRVGCAAKR